MEPRTGSIGDWLRRARTEKGLTIADVEQALKIRARYVQALETDDFAILPPMVYTRALLRDYARLLGLDPGEMLDRALPMRAADRNPIREAIRPLEKEAAVSWKLIAVVVAAGVMASLLFYLYTQFESFNRGVEAVESRAPQALPTRGGVSSPLLTAAPATSVALTPTPEASPTPITGIVVEARISEPSWVQVWADGRSILAETLPPGTTRTFSADQSVRMRVGNAGAVDITANGVPQGRLGGPGQALDATWARG
jgi:cytoskeletal protein RodZ